MPDFTDNLKPKYDGSATIEAERARSSVKVDELTKQLLSRNGFLDRQERILRILEKEPLCSKKQQMNLSRPVHGSNQLEKCILILDRNDIIWA